MKEKSSCCSRLRADELWRSSPKWSRRSFLRRRDADPGPFASLLVAAVQLAGSRSAFADAIGRITAGGAITRSFLSRRYSGPAAETFTTVEDAKAAISDTQQTFYTADVVSWCLVVDNLPSFQAAKFRSMRHRMGQALERLMILGRHRADRDTLNRAGLRPADQLCGEAVRMAFFAGDATLHQNVGRRHVTVLKRAILLPWGRRNR